MGTFTRKTHIDAPKAQVWEVLADLGSIAKWSPGVTASHCTSEAQRGEGATRHCDIEGMGGKPAYLEERAFDWREGEGFKIDVYETNLPIKRNVVTFSLSESDDGTIVEASPDYELKFGPIGSLMDKLMVRRRFEAGMEGLLAGLKNDVESSSGGSGEAAASG